jgi:hypothetical protein
MLTSLSVPDLTFVFIAVVFTLGTALLGLLAQVTPQLQRKRVTARRR